MEVTITLHPANSFIRHLPIYLGLHREPSMGTLCNDFIFGSAYYTKTRDYRIFERKQSLVQFTEQSVPKLYARIPVVGSAIGLSADIENNLITIYVNGNKFYSFSPMSFTLKENDDPWYFAIYNELMETLSGKFNFGRYKFEYPQKDCISLYEAYAIPEQPAPPTEPPTNPHNGMDFRFSDIESKIKAENTIAPIGADGHRHPFLIHNKPEMNHESGNTRFNMMKRNDVDMTTINLPLPTDCKVYLEANIKNCVIKEDVFGIPITFGITDTINSIDNHAFVVDLFHEKQTTYWTHSFVNGVKVNYKVLKVFNPSSPTQPNTVGILIDLKNSYIGIYTEGELYMEARIQGFDCTQYTPLHYGFFRADNDVIADTHPSEPNILYGEVNFGEEVIDFDLPKDSKTIYAYWNDVIRWYMEDDPSMGFKCRMKVRPYVTEYMVGIDCTMNVPRMGAVVNDFTPGMNMLWGTYNIVTDTKPHRNVPKISPYDFDKMVDDCIEHLNDEISRIKFSCIMSVIMPRKSIIYDIFSRLKMMGVESSKNIIKGKFTMPIPDFSHYRLFTGKITNFERSMLDPNNKAHMIKGLLKLIIPPAPKYKMMDLLPDKYKTMTTVPYTVEELNKIIDDWEEYCIYKDKISEHYYFLYLKEMFFDCEKLSNFDDMLQGKINVYRKNKDTDIWRFEDYTYFASTSNTEIISLLTIDKLEDFNANNPKIKALCDQIAGAKYLPKINNHSNSVIRISNDCFFGLKFNHLSYPITDSVTIIQQPDTIIYAFDLGSYLTTFKTSKIIINLKKITGRFGCYLPSSAYLEYDTEEELNLMKYIESKYPEYVSPIYKIFGNDKYKRCMNKIDVNLESNILIDLNFKNYRKLIREKLTINGNNKSESISVYITFSNAILLNGIADYANNNYEFYIKETIYNNACIISFDYIHQLIFTNFKNQYIDYFRDPKPLIIDTNSSKPINLYFNDIIYIDWSNMNSYVDLTKLIKIKGENSRVNLGLRNLNYIKLNDDNNIIDTNIKILEILKGNIPYEDFIIKMLDLTKFNTTRIDLRESYLFYFNDDLLINSTDNYISIVNKYRYIQVKKIRINAKYLETVDGMFTVAHCTYPKTQSLIKYKFQPSKWVLQEVTFINPNSRIRPKLTHEVMDYQVITTNSSGGQLSPPIIIGTTLPYKIKIEYT